MEQSANIIYNERDFDAICKMIELCREQGAVPILLIPPFLKEYKDKMKAETPEYCCDGFYQIIPRICSDIGVEYYDYSEDTRFTSKYEKLENCDYLNKEGAREFTDIIMRVKI